MEQLKGHRKPSLLESKECKDSLEDLVKRIERGYKADIEHIDRFHKLTSEERDNFIRKTISKYNSKEYKDRWSKRGINPPETLYNLFFDYGEKYGTPQDSDKQFGNGKYIFDNKWIVEIMCGQGTVILISEKEENNEQHRFHHFVDKEQEYSQQEDDNSSESLEL